MTDAKVLVVQSRVEGTKASLGLSPQNANPGTGFTCLLSSLSPATGTAQRLPLKALGVAASAGMQASLPWAKGILLPPGSGLLLRYGVSFSGTWGPPGSSLSFSSQRDGYMEPPHKDYYPVSKAGVNGTSPASCESRDGEDGTLAD